ncbi:hypothetical protein [Microbacterium sp. NPDC090003]|uniref:hypothetical protein n=1 Tax=Microbacterium sp. NPDC090003 TaxID=3364203 RepID=UPI003826E17F
MWVAITQFAAPAADDRTTLAALIASPKFADDYITPPELTPDSISQFSVHGRWWLTAITVDGFLPVSQDTAIERIRTWADDQEWSVPDYRQPPEVFERLEKAFDVLRSGVVYALSNPDDEHEHEYGMVLGRGGYLEFVVIDRERDIVSVIVAADD